MKRNETRQIKVRNTLIGGTNKVTIQSMTNCKTSDIDKTIKQINELEILGCDIVRMSISDMEDALAIKEIRKKTNLPLVADIHFDYKLALVAIDNGIDKIRINPGNIGKRENVEQVVLKCLEHHIPIRIGINSGSIEKDLLNPDGSVSVESMMISAKRHVDILESMNFFDIVLSFKASDVNLTIEAYREASKRFPYPLHLGVTEAGTFFTSSIKSSMALGALLHDGIGDTIRVSVSDKPAEELKIAKAILNGVGLYPNYANLISCPTCGRTKWDLIPLAKRMEEYLQSVHYPVNVSIMGCVVNGPGEATNADIGIAGGGKDEGLLFKKGQVIKKVKAEDYERVLMEEINKFINEND